MTSRFYSEEFGDFYRLCYFITQNVAYFRRYSTMSIVHLVDWKYGIYDNKRAFASMLEEHVHLRFDGFNQLAGAVISENGGADF